MKKPSLQVVAIAANATFWLLFAVLFVSAARNDNPARCIDKCHAAYEFWGLGLGYNANPFTLLFMKLMAYLQAPSFFFCRALEYAWNGEPVAEAFSLQYPDLVGGALHFGLSNDAYQLLSTMFLSFVQWWFIARLIKTLPRRTPA
jgi:hypothetical protein